MNIVKNWAFNRRLFNLSPVINGNQWIIPAIIEKIAPMDRT